MLGFIFIIGPAYSLDGLGTIDNGYRGDITEPFTFAGTVYVVGKINVNSTLNIDPGTTIIISFGKEFVVNTLGSISARGTESSPIIFKARELTWGCIRFMTSTIGSEFTYCTFENGRSSSGYNDGGAIRILQSPDISFTSCSFKSNIAVDYVIEESPGDDDAGGGAIYASSTTGLTIEDCSFIANSAEDGGAIVLFDVDCEITGCTFEKNRATKSDGRAGAIFVHAGFAYNILIDRCKVYSNSTPDRTGGIHFDTGSGGTVQNCLIYSNTSTIGGGVSMGNNGAITDGTVNILNCVIAENIPCDVTFRTSVGFSVRNSIMWGSDASVSYIPGHGGGAPLASNLINCAVQGATDRSGNQIDIEQTFINSFKLNASNNEPDGPNFVNPLTDYSILAVSPCKDKGISTDVPTTDILGYARTVPFDIGAYEVQRKLLSWTGAVNSEWMRNDNWSPASIPESSDDVRISDVVNSPIISSGKIGQSYNLIIESPAELTIETGGSLNAAGSVIINSSSTNNSGSVINQGTVIGTVVYNRLIPIDETTQLWHYISSPVVTNSFVSAKEFYPWNEVAGDWGSPVSSLLSGVGYTVIGGGSVSFIGTLQSLDFTVDATSPYEDVLSGTDYSGRDYVDDEDDGHSDATRSYSNYGGGGFNLLGNPFTSSLRISDTDGNINNDFLGANQSKFDPNYVAVYIYNGNLYRYIGNSTGWNPPSIDPEEMTGTSHIQVGQAFFVLAMNDYAEFSFNREMQVHNTTVPLLKSSGSDKRWPGILLKVKNGEKESSTLVVYDPGMTVNLDPGYDIGFISGGADIEIYSHLPTTGNVNYTRQALPLSGADSVIIPIGIDTRTGGEVIFSADAITFKSYRYLLEDRQAGRFIDISKREYKTTVAPETYGTGRFYLHTAYADRRNTQCGLPVNESAEVLIWTYGHDVIIKGPVNPGALCEIFNLQGQKVLSVNLTDGELNTVTASNIRGTNIVRVSDGAEVHTAKIIIR